MGLFLIEPQTTHQQANSGVDNETRHRLVLITTEHPQSRKYIGAQKIIAE